MNSRWFALLLTWLLAASASAQTGQPAQAAQPVPVIIDSQDADQTREDLRNLLRQYPPSVARVFALDPSLLNNQAYMASYPQLAAFLQGQPSIAHNPAFFFGTPDQDFRANTPELEAIRMWRGMAEGIVMFSVFTLVLAFLAWMAKSLIDYRRWGQVSRVHTEAHNKLLDRFTGHDELLAYIQTPAGRRFLEAAPVDVGPRSISAPIGRVLWSAQVGMVLAAGGVGLNFASGQVVAEVQPPLVVLGILAVALGLGFILSAVAAYLLSRRLGLFESQSNANA
jgi:hypothetical protein